MQRLQTRTVRLEAKEAVELKPGIVLPPGYHTAIKTRTVFETIRGKTTRTDPQFSIKFTAKQFARMGATDIISLEIDVTEFVRDGKLNQH